LENFSRKKIGERSSKIETRRMLSSHSSLKAEGHFFPFKKEGRIFSLYLNPCTERKARRKSRGSGRPD
jgi:hypothetical protein